MSSNDLARSREGRGLSVRGGDSDKWITIQKNTFRNWVNLQLQGSGLVVDDFEVDFDDGVKLCALVEALQHKKIGKIIKKPLNHHQSLENVSLALKAIADDNVRLVNIGSEDIVNGSLKLILGLVWMLILRYQIGRTKFSPKKLMLAWLKAVIPECHISNFTTDWNDGVALSALVEYCQHGLFPDWRNLSRHNRLENCTDAINVARERLNVPMVLRPEDLSDPNLDELSGMTYLSYFMMQDSPGYFATRRDIRKILQAGSIENFTTDWNDGKLLCNLVMSVGGDISGWPNLRNDPVTNLQKGLDEGKRLGVEPIFSAVEIADPEVEHLGVMAYAAYYIRLTPVKLKWNPGRLDANLEGAYLGREKSFQVVLEDGSADQMRAELIGLNSSPPVDMRWSGSTAYCTFTPVETGQHKLDVLCDGNSISGSPVNFLVLADRSRVVFNRPEHACVGASTDLEVDVSSSGQGSVHMEARSPYGNVQTITCLYRSGVFDANFIPNEVGTWYISVQYDGEHISGSPFAFNVFDPSLVRVYGLEGGTIGQALSFNANASDAGSGSLHVRVVHDMSDVPCSVRDDGTGLYSIEFTPHSIGRYSIYVYFNSMEVKGSPFIKEIFDSSLVTLSGEGISLVPVGKVTNFTIHTKGAGSGSVNVDIAAPNGESLKYQLHQVDGETTEVQYTPIQIGEYKISVKYDGQLVQGSPFICTAFSGPGVIVSDVPQYCLPGHQVSFNINAAQAGSGNIEIRVNDGRVSCTVQNMGNHRFVASFLPEDLQPHTIAVTFNDHLVQGSPWKIKMIDPQLIQITSSDKGIVPVRRAAAFTITHCPPTADQIKIIVTAVHYEGHQGMHHADPKGDSLPLDKTTNDDGDVVVTYTPVQVGDHQISVQCLGQEVKGSPFITKAYDTAAITVTPLEDGFVGLPIYFTIDVQAAGEGQLQIMVNGGEIPNEVDPQDLGVYKISFVPVEEGSQQVDIHFNEERLPMCPLRCKAIVVEGEVTGMMDLVAVDTQTSFTVRSAAHLTARVNVLSPSGQTVPCDITKNGASTSVAYTPEEVGTYTISISTADKAMEGSPFKVKTYDLSKVKVSKLSQGIVGMASKFTVDTEGAGEGMMEIVVTGDGRKIPNQAQAVGKGQYQVSFTPQQAAVHAVTVTYNGQHVFGSPFYVRIIDAGDMTVSDEGRLRLVARGQGAHFIINTAAPNLQLHDDLSVLITDPGGQLTPARLSDCGDGNYRVDWVPNTVGVYNVAVEYSCVAISGSPYSVQVYDAALVTVSGIRQGLVGRPFTFFLDADKAGDGDLEIHVTAEGESITNTAEQEKDAKFSVTFIPQRAVRHKISVMFNGDQVPGSPFVCHIMDTSSMKLNGEGLCIAPANAVASFVVDPKGARDFELTVRVLCPTGQDVPVRISGSPHSTFCVEYIPVDVGIHRVYVHYGGIEMKGSPFTVHIFDPVLVRVNSTGRAYLSKPFHVYLDRSVAGQGQLKAEVKGGGKVVPCQLREMGDGRCELVFTPYDVNTHTVWLTFGGLPLPGSPFGVDVIDCGGISVTGEGLYSARVGSKAFFNMDLHGLDASDIDISVTDPSDNKVLYGISRTGHIFRVELVPMVVGPHQVQVLFSGSHILGSPFTCEAYDPARVRITDVDRFAKKGREIGFTVDTSAAGKGDIDIAITLQGQKVQTHQKGVGGGLFRYTFFPRETGQFEVKATFNKENVPGCPLLVSVEEDSPTFITISYLSLEPISVKDGPRKNCFVLHMAGHAIDTEKLHINIEAPTGEQLDSNLIQTRDGDYRVEWTPKQTGRHTVDVLFSGHRVTGSPFYIDVFDVRRIHVDKFFCGKVDQQAGFSVDASLAGKCEQTVRVVSPTGQSVPVTVSQTASCCYSVTYTPRESGQHEIFLTYNSLELPGCPFTQMIGEGVFPPAYGDGLYHGEEDRTATFHIDARGLVGEPSVHVVGPNSVAKVSIDPKPDGQYVVTYVPVEVGLYDIQINWNGKELNGSPYHPKVVCSRKVLVVGGWQHYMDSKERVHLVVNEEKQIPFDVSQAGPGTMKAEVRSPSGIIPSSIDESSPGRSTIIFTPREEGIHYIHIFWSEIALDNSPFHGYATNVTLDPSKVILTGRGLKEAIVREEAEFVIDASKAGSGKPEVQLTGVRAEVNVFITPLGGGKFRCTYIPVVPGAYLLHISWNARQLRGSPYKVNVIGAFYPNKVIVTGEGIKGGLMGQDLDFHIDTRKAGPGELTAYCMGPTKVAVCELEDHHDGTFRLNVRPQDVGRHVLQVKYGGEHVLGSPFDFKVGALPDASKVRVSGPGVEHGILATFQSRFMVETRGAGAGQLTVRIRGPKGAFQVEMYRDSQKDRTILCRYDPAETGLYIVSVRWSGVDVPGSPFHVHILDTQAELEQVLADQTFHSANFNPSRAGSGYGQWKQPGF